MHRPRGLHSRNGLSMVEAVIATAITAMTGTALLVGLTSAVQSSTITSRAAVARGLAQMMMAEISAAQFPPSVATIPTGSDRSDFDDIDDYDGWVSVPSDRDGNTLGTQLETVSATTVARPVDLLANQEALGFYQREVTVDRISPNPDGTWQIVSQHTNFRRVTVSVKFVDATSSTSTLHEITRIFTYISPTP